MVATWVWAGLAVWGSLAVAGDAEAERAHRLPNDGAPEVVRVGAGSYASRPPRDQNKRPWLPGRAGWGDDSQVYSRMRLYVNPDRRGPVPSTDWWTGLVTRRWSTQLWAYPSMLQAVPDGMEIRAPHAWEVSADAKTAVLAAKHALRVGGVDFVPLHAEADAWSDWLVRARMPDRKGASLRFTFGHGLPFTHVEFDGVVPWVDVGAATLFGPGAGKQPADRVGVRFDEHERFGVYAPAGTRFTRQGSRLLFTFPSLPEGRRPYLAIAPLATEGDLDKLAPYAPVVPRKTVVEWDYQPEQGAVDTVWTIESEDLSGQGARDVVQGWIPHHYQAPARADFALDGPRYPTPRGELRCAVGRRFAIRFPFRGILPEWPSPELLPGADPTYRPEQLRALVRDHLKETGYGSETYWGGKRVRLFGRHLEFARQLGLTEETAVFRDRAAEAVRDWLTFDPGEGEHFFAWYPRWGSFVGCRSRDNANPGVDILQDHHMCYGYHIYTAAILSLHDPAFARDWGPMARLVAKDYAEWDPESPLFCRFRNLDPWSGHSWSGGLGSTEGNGQESSSEAMQGYGAMFLLGEALGDHAMRDAAAFCWAMEARGIAEYYFDRGKRNFPAAWPHTVCSNVHTNGLGFWTWFSGNPFWMHAIQWIPMSPLIGYLGEDPAYARADFERMWATHEGGRGWADYLGNDGGVSCLTTNYLALFDPARAEKTFNDLADAGRGGARGAEATGAYWHIAAAKRYGSLRFDAWTDVATSMAFGAAGDTANIAWAVFNAGDRPRTVRCFVEGREVATFIAPPRRMSVMKNGEVHTDRGAMEAVPPPPAPQEDATPASEGRPATASSQQGGDTGPDNAFDGDGDTRWSSRATDGEWIAVDLGAKTELSHARLVWEAAYGKDYDLEGSDDGAAWTPLAHVRDGQGGTETVSLKGSARHVRLKGIKRGTDWGWSLFTFDIFARASAGGGERLVVEPSLALLNELDTVSFKAFVETEKGPQREVKAAWSLRGPGRIDANGTFTPEGGGVFDRPRVMVEAEYEGRLRGRARAVVEEALRVARVTLTPHNADGALMLSVGDTLTFETEAFDQFGAWIEATPTITVTGPFAFADGVLTAKALGQGTLTAELAGRKISQALEAVKPSAVDVAAGRPARATSTEGDMTAERAFDRNPKTRWSSQSKDPQSIEVDLGRERGLGRIVLVWEAAHAKKYTIEVAGEDGRWRTVHTQNASRGGREEIKLKAGTKGRHVRLTGTARATGYGYSLFSFEVYPSE